MQQGKLFIVATPIGNLADMTMRALEVLKAVDYILAEDTRVSLKLVAHYGIKKQLISYNEHSGHNKDQIILANLKLGKSYALVSDAGTPAVSDPGARLVAEVVKAGFEVVPVVGASAVSAIVSVCGFVANAHHFWGFFPQKKIRQRELLANIASIDGIHVFFESPYRIIKTLKECFAGRADLQMVVGRELTKMHETIYRGLPGEVLAQVEANVVKGEFVVAVCNTSGA